MSDERWNRLEYIIEEAVPEDIPGWRFRYSKQVAAAVEAAGFRKLQPSEAQVTAAMREASRRSLMWRTRKDVMAVLIAAYAETDHEGSMHV